VDEKVRPNSNNEGGQEKVVQLTAGEGRVDREREPKPEGDDWITVQVGGARVELREQIQMYATNDQVGRFSLFEI
jgi:hypothetical protein